MNRFSAFTKPVAGGHHGMIRLARDGGAKPILGKHGTPVIFPTEKEAWKAVTRHLVGYLNGSLVRCGERAGTAKQNAEAIFVKGRRVAVEVRP
jgi:hypothetical protein